MNVVGLYAATCRCVLRARPEDPESWADLATLLPILRQALACCVCAGILNVPMAPMETICQHHVCRTCIGGKMRVKPTCSWCKEWDDFVEKPQVRSLVQCFKGLCKYLASSSLANDLVQTSNGGKSSLMTLVQEGAAISDVYVPPEPDLKLGFIPVLPSATVSSVTQPLKVDCGSPHQSPKRHWQEKSVGPVKKEVKESSSGKVKSDTKQETTPTKNSKSNDHHIDTHLHSPKRNTRTREHEHPIKNASCKETKQPHKKEREHVHRKEHKSEKQKRSDKCDKRETPKTEKEDNINLPSKSENEKPKHLTRADRNIFQTVVAEHDYNAAWSIPESPRTRTRRASGYRSDDSAGPRSPATKRHRLGSGSDSVHIPASLEEATLQPSVPPLTRVLPPQSQTPSSVAKQVTDDPKLTWPVKARKRINKKPKPKGCRCGLATPNPGKLTCCGQRCPCYSAFKGCCPDCRCRGCRNPRRLIPDVPAPPPPPELFPPESTLTLTDVNSESEDSEIEIDI